MAERFVQSHIRNLPLFQQLTPPQIGVLANVVQVLRFDPGQLVVQEGQPDQGLLLFVSGRGILTRYAPNGAQETVGAVTAGQYIDEPALYTAGVEALSLHVVEAAIVLLIPRGSFVQLIRQYPEIRANLRIQTAPSAQAVAPGQPTPTRDTAARLFRGQRTDETVLQVWRRHWWAAARHGWIPALVAVGLFVLALVIAEQAPALALGAAGMAVVIPGIIIAYLYYDWQDDSVILTDQRVVRIWHQVLLFETEINEMPLDQVLEVNTSIPPGDPFARLFQYGNITVHAAGQGINMILDMMPQPMTVQSMIFAQRDRFKERLEQRQRDAVRNDIQEALGMSPPAPGAEYPLASPVGKEHNIGLPFIRTKAIASNGDLIYRRHSSIWIQSVFWPALVIGAAFVLFLLVLLLPNFPLRGALGLAVSMFVLIVGAVWFYFADWDWRNDLFIIGSETITLVNQRPLWLQNEVERIRIAQIDNVRSEVHGLINNLIDRGDVRISLIGTDVKDAKVMDNVLDPQEIQAEISRRQSMLKAERQQSDIDQQREVIKEYLQTYHEIAQTQEAGRVVPQQSAQPTQALPPAQPTFYVPAQTAQAPASQPTIPVPPAQPTYYPPPPNVPEESQIPPPINRDGIRPPRVPRSRPD
ncbi:MAG TPA: cyclic nucleotide-binding domain-containing protein [Phototrophicaceae bacterium]|nr:cyclic nucleotide-binding domain-containing protein [Phototrophicaceae bacterium]